MSLLDARGRLFGRVNVVDAGVLAVVCLLIPLAYAAWFLFRVPPPHLSALEPAEVTTGTTQVTLTGRELRPYYRVILDDTPAQMAYVNTDQATLILPPTLPIGAYDLTLLDEAQPLAVLSRALVVLPPPAIPIGSARFQVDSDDEATVAGEPWRHVVVRDVVSNSCTLYRRRGEGGLEQVSAVQCAPLIPTLNSLNLR